MSADRFSGHPGIVCSSGLPLSLTEDEFFGLVFSGANPWPDDVEPDLDADETQLHATPCDTCGEVGACGYDAEGRALIHATQPDYEDDCETGGGHPS